MKAFRVALVFSMSFTFSVGSGFDKVNDNGGGGGEVGILDSVKLGNKQLDSKKIIESKRNILPILLADNSQIDSKNTESNLQDSSDLQSTQDIKQYRLNAVTAIANDANKTYQSSSGFINSQMIESNPSGNGDIGSLLRILPNVQFDNALNNSNTPGEINPAQISISGGLFYQNNFQLDGFNMNNDINPNGAPLAGNHNHLQWGSSASQGLNIDTSLLDSINVLDSNISAAYGGFSGGVIEANVRKPRSDSWHGGISYQHTSNLFTQQFIADSALEDFYTSTNETYQPNFSKHLVKSNIEGYITKNLGLIASYSTTRSYIPLQAYSSSYTQGSDIESKRDQKRISDNYYIKLNYNPLESLNIEANIAYMPQNNTYFRAGVQDSFWSLKSGGVQSGLKALWDSGIGVLTNQIGYSFMESSRDAEANYWASWKYSSDKNWGSINGTSVTQGGFGDMNQNSHTLSYKSDMKFESLNFWITKHTFRTGLEMNYQNVMRERKDGYYVFTRFLTGSTSALQNLNGANCGVDSLGLNSCSEGLTYDGWQGQYFNQVRGHIPGKNTFDNFSYGIYVENDIAWDFGIGGVLNTRLGVRLDGDNYMDNHTLAPRFSLSYVTPTQRDYQTSFIFGINRYYARNILSYRIMDSDASNAYKYYSRPDASSPWQEHKELSQGPVSNSVFKKLNLPYNDEFMGGITQNLWWFSLVAKYIHRNGKDEIIRQQNPTSDRPSGDSAIYSRTSWVYSNDGKSYADIISISIQNVKPIETFGISHFYLFAFDWTQSKRSYNPILDNNDEGGNYIGNDLILYNGNLIRYQERPVDNFARPFTLRLTTTHTFNIWRTRWTWNNFFRFRSSFIQTVLIHNPDYTQYYQRCATNPRFCPHPNYDPTHADKKQFSSQTFGGAFTWDMRIGFEIDVWRKNTLYVNLDIYNVLNNKYQTATSVSGTIANGIADSTLGATTTAVYALGRQFWLQVGYKF